MTMEGFDRLKKAYNLDGKFEDFPKLVAHVIDSLEVTKKNFVHVHLVEDCCSYVIFSKNYLGDKETSIFLTFDEMSKLTT